LSKKREDVSAFDYINSIIREHNVASSFGTLVLRNGVLVKVRKYFDYFREIWNEYKYLDAIGSKEEMEDFIKNKTVGGIISNGELDIYIPDVIATVSEHKMLENLQEEKDSLEED
jgi:hypothetical protein